MLVTLSGIVMLVRLCGPTKASLPMFVTDFPSIISGITSSPDASSAQPVIVTTSPSITYFKLGLIDTDFGGLASVAAPPIGLSEGATLLFSPSHPMRRLKAKRGIKYFIFVCDDAEVDFREILQSKEDFITQTAPLNPSCVLEAGFVSHGFTAPHKQHPPIRKGER